MMYPLAMRSITALGHVAQCLFVGQPASHIGGIGLLPWDFCAPVTQRLPLTYSTLTTDRPDSIEEPSITHLLINGLSSMLANPFPSIVM